MDVGRRDKDSWDRDKDSLFLTVVSVARVLSFILKNKKHNKQSQMITN